MRGVLVGMPTDSALERIVSLVLSATTPTPSRPGFGAALIAAPDATGAFGSSLVRRASDPAGVSAMGFAANGPTMRDVNAYFAQANRPEFVYIGRRQAKPTRIVTLTVVTPEVGAVYSAELNGVTFSFTAATAVAADVATGLAAAIVSGTAGYTKAAVGAVITLTASVAGTSPMIRNISVTHPDGPTASALVAKDTTVDPGIADDLADIFATPLGSEAFGLLTPGAGPEEIEAAATWATANERIYAAQVFDTSILDANVTDDAASEITALRPRFLLLTVRRVSSDSPVSAAILGRCLAVTPGSINFAHKTLSLVEGDAFNADEIATVADKFANVYTSIQRVNVFFDGRMGDGGWADEVIGSAFLQSELKIGVFEELLAHDKVPYTDAGADLLRARVKAILLMLAQDPYNIIDPARDITVTMPAISSLSVQQRASREWPDIFFECFYQGAINSVKMRGKITP